MGHSRLIHIQMNTCTQFANGCMPFGVAQVQEGVRKGEKAGCGFAVSGLGRHWIPWTGIALRRP